MLAQLATILPYLVYCFHWDRTRNAWVQLWPWLILTSGPPDLVDGDQYQIWVSQDCTILYYAPNGRTYEIALLNVAPAYNTIVWQPKPLPSLQPRAHIVSVAAPLSARAGDQVEVQVTLANTGAGTGDCLCDLVYSYADAPQLLPGAWKRFSPNESAVYNFAFTMPGVAVTLYAESYHLDPDTSQRVYDETTPAQAVAVQVDETARIQKPDWLSSVLDSGVLNITQGQWMDLWAIKIPPFSFEPGRWIESGIDLLLVPVNFIMDTVRTHGQNIKDMWDKVWEVADNLFDWLSSSASWVLDHITTWWDSVYPDILDAIRSVGNFTVSLYQAVISQLVMLSGRLDGISSVLQELPISVPQYVLQNPTFRTLFDMASFSYEAVLLLPKELPDFFANPPLYIFHKIDDWLNEKED